MLASLGEEVPGIILQEANIIMVQNQNEGAGYDPDDWTYEALDKKWEEYQIEHEKQIEQFIPEREREVQELYKKHGFNELAKPVDKIIDNNRIIDPDKS